MGIRGRADSLTPVFIAVTPEVGARPIPIFKYF